MRRLICLSLFWLCLALPAAAQEDTCVLPDRGYAKWTEAEQHLWTVLCRAGESYLDLSWYDDGDYPCLPTEIDGTIPDNRYISADLIRRILTSPTLMSSLGQNRLHLRCAVIEDELDLSYQSIPAGLFCKTASCKRPCSCKRRVLLIR